MAAPLTPVPARPRPPGRGLLLGGIFPRPVSPTSQPFTWSRAERFEGPIHALPRTGAELCSRSSPRRGGRWAQRLGSPVSPHPSDSPSRAYLSWRRTHRSTQLKSHPSASLPRVPAKAGAWKPGRNKCAWMPRRAGLRAAKLAGGRRGRWLCCAGRRAQGSRPGRRPRPPRPQPAPTAGGGTRPGPRPPLRRRPPRRRGGNAGLGHSGRLRLALATAPPPRRGPGRSAQQPLPLGAPELESRDPGAKREELEAQGTPSLSFTLSSPDEPAEPLLLSLPPRRGGGCRSCHSSSWSKGRTPSPCGWIPPRPASPPPGEPRPRRTQLAPSAPPWRTVTPDLLR